MPLLLALIALIGAAGSPRPASGQASRVYAVWPHSDYKPWQSDIYAREPEFVLRELDWMREVGINTYLPLALASGRVNWPPEQFPDTQALFGTRSPLDTTVRGGDERGIATELYVLMGFVGFLEDPWAAPDLRANPDWDVVGADGKGTLSGEAGTATIWGTFLWWDLGNPAVQDRILGMLAEALDRYPMFYGDARALWSVEGYLRDTVAELDRRAAAAGHRRAAVVLGLATAWYDPLPPEQAEDLITRALANGADGVALQTLPYWWQEEYRQFRRYYRPRSEGWSPLWDYDATLKRVFRAA